MTKDQMTKVQVIEIIAGNFKRHLVILHILSNASCGSFETVDL